MNPSKNFNRLGFYESSFHFFLKRSQNFNSLHENNITSTIVNNKFNRPFKFNNSFKEIYKYSFYENVRKNLSNISISQLESSKSIILDHKLVTHNSTQDYVLVSEFKNILNKKNTELIYNLTKPVSNFSNNLRTYSPILEDTKTLE
jgi:hypothetical protein